MKTRIYLIRHAEAEGNLYRRSQGQYNSNVTCLGRAQIAALAERFRDVPLDALWSSDLYRTQSTASAIRKYHPALELNLEPRLREIDVGVWEDMPWGNISLDYPEQMFYFSHDPARWSVPGGEPYEAVQARMRAVVLELAERYPGGSVAAVSHGLAMRSLLCSIFGVPSEEIDRIPYGDNTSVTLLTAEDGKLAVEWYNDASHLTERGISTFARQGWWREKAKQTPAAKVYSHFAPLDPRRESELYTRLYEATWRESHGSLNGFTPAVYLHSAGQHADQDPRCIMKLFTGEEFAGIIELDPNRGAEDGAGWISLVYLEPGARGRRLGVQLIGHAVSFFRREGRRSLRLHVAYDNESAFGFYEHIGFRDVGRTRGALGPLHLMEMDIRQRIIPPEEIG